MCIALPNDEKTFTVTLFLPNQGDPSFASVETPAQARALFERDFADAVPLIPALEQDWQRNPVGLLATLYLTPGTSMGVLYCSATRRMRWCHSTAKA